MNSLILPFIIPIITALLCSLFLGKPSRARRIFIALSALLQLGLSLFLAYQVFTGDVMVLHLGRWSAQIGIVLVLDELAAIMLCLSTTISLACILFAYAEMPLWSEQPLRLPLMQLLAAGINLSFLTGDLFNLFVAFEIMLVSSYALLTLEANDRDVKEAFPYLAVNMVGSTLFLVAAALAYAVFGTLNFAEISVRAEAMPGNFGVMLVALLLMFVFGLKAGIFPLYYWLPNSYPILPLSLGAFYSGMLTKVGVYVMLRTLGTVFPHSLESIHAALGWLAGLTMVLAVLGAVSRQFIRGILSFHIVSQIGYMVLAIGIFTPLSITACIYYVIHHIIVKSSLFLIASTAIFYSRTDNLARMGGLWKASPILGVCFLIQAFSLAGVPPLSGFWGKYVIIVEGIRTEHYWLVVAALLASILTLVSMLKIWLGAFWQPPPEGHVIVRTADTKFMTTIIVMLTLISLTIGFGAEDFLKISEAASASVMNQEAYRDAVLTFKGKDGVP